MLTGENLFHLGIGVLVIGGVASVVAVVLLLLSKRRLEKTLQREYGPKRR